MTSTLDKQSYFLSSRNMIYNLVFISPMIIIYEAMILLYRYNSEMIPSYFRNGVDVMVRSFFDEFGASGNIIYFIAILSIFLFIVANNYEVIKKGKINFNFLMYMLVESIFIASIFTLVIVSVSSMVIFELSEQHTTIFELFYLSVGAGIWEEILFRFIMMGSIIFVCNRIIDLSLPSSVFAAILMSSFLFAGFHYIGPYGEDFNAYTYLVRYLGGVVLGLIYFIRGIGIAVYTHIFYDLAVCLSAQ